MTTYEYTCAACLHKWEAEHPMPGPAHPRCPFCASRRTRKVLSAPTVALLGDGWATKKSDAEQDAEDGTQ